MRTTVTIDPDVQQLLRQAMQQTAEGFKVTLNQAIRKGLAGTVSSVEEAPFVVASQSMGLRAGIDSTQLQQMGDEIEVEAFLALSQGLPPASEQAP